MKTYTLKDIEDTIIEDEKIIYCLDEDNSITIEEGTAYFSTDNCVTFIEIDAPDFAKLANEQLQEIEDERLMREYGYQDKETGEWLIDERQLHKECHASHLADL